MSASTVQLIDLEVYLVSTVRSFRFALFVVAAVPDLMDGDDERSFGVWRIQSGKRMYTAYHVHLAAKMTLLI